MVESHPIYFQANRRWLMSWSKASSPFLLSPLLLSSDVSTGDSAHHTNYFWAHPFMCTHVHVSNHTSSQGSTGRKTWIDYECRIPILQSRTHTGENQKNISVHTLWALCLVYQLLKVCERVRGLVFKKTERPRQCHYQKCFTRQIISRGVRLK